ncbi:hypothetical protein ABZ512_20000 [Nocardiopsis dassonvillei]|uniref:hypothetical protein n=1 Tax=Nocardiopsis dassonvillei TaxID=2014 RepID=UPI0033F470A5
MPPSDSPHPTPPVPPPTQARSSRRSMYVTGGLFLIAGLASCGQTGSSGTALVALVAVYGAACLICGYLLRRPSRAVYVSAVGLQLLLLVLVLALAVWAVIAGFWLGLVFAVLPLVLVANTLHLLHQSRGFYLRGL